MGCSRGPSTSPIFYQVRRLGARCRLLAGRPTICCGELLVYNYILLKHFAIIPFQRFNPLESKGNYCATSNNVKLIHWPLMGGLLHLIQQGGDWGAQPAQALLAVPNVTAHPSTANVPITVLLYNGPLLSGFNMPIKG